MCVAQQKAANLADHFFSEGNYREAITEYKRNLFYIDKSEEKWLTMCKIASSYLFLEDKTNTIIYINKAKDFSTNDSLSDEIKLFQANSYLFFKDYQLANLLLYRLVNFSKYSVIINKAKKIIILKFILAHEWDELNDFLEKNKIASSVDDVKKIIADEKEKTLIPSWAGTLSTFFPGLGQFYAGDVENGLNAVLLNGFLLYSVLNSFIIKDLVDCITWSMLLYRYYVGNIEKAEKIVEKENLQLDYQTKKRTLQFFRQYFMDN